MHKGSTRVHGAIYLCSEPHNLHRDHEILNLVLWWAWHNVKKTSFVPISLDHRRYHKLVLDFNWKSIASSCCHFEIPIEDIFLDMPHWKIIHKYQLKYDLYNFYTNWKSLHKLMLIWMDSCISWFHLGNANKDKR